MKTRYSFALAALAMTFALAAPAGAQDVAKEGDAAAKESMEAHNEMMGEGCQCACMKGMHEKMMSGDAEGMAHDGHEGHAEGEAHAEGMDSDAAHAEMMAAHTEMMAGCKCMAGGEGDDAMSCKMHGEHEMGAAEGEGMQHQHGMEADEEAESETDGRD